MNISGFQNNNILSKIQKSTIEHKVFVPPFTKSDNIDDSLAKETPAVTVSISPEGKESYRNSLLDKGETYESVLNRKNELRLEENQIDAFIFEFTPLGGKKTVEDIASDLLKAYAKQYNVIVQGYKTGERVRYVQDPEAENGRRQKTMSEELNSLNEYYKSAVETLEVQIKRYAEEVKIFEDYQNFSSKYLDKQDDEMEKVRKPISRSGNDVILENLSEKMMDAVKAFVEQYSQQETIDLESMLKNIDTFNADR